MKHISKAMVHIWTTRSYVPEGSNIPGSLKVHLTIVLLPLYYINVNVKQILNRIFKCNTIPLTKHERYLQVLQVPPASQLLHQEP
jgi:hypothetical protein